MILIIFEPLERKHSPESGVVRDNLCTKCSIIKFRTVSDRAGPIIAVTVPWDRSDSIIYHFWCSITVESNQIYTLVPNSVFFYRMKFRTASDCPGPLRQPRSSTNRYQCSLIIL